MKTLLIPLDERPCNRVFPEMIGKTNQDIDLLVPDMDLFGHKKEPTDVKLFFFQAEDGIRDQVV